MNNNLDELYEHASGEFHHKERNRLLSLLSAIFPASLERHQPEGELPNGWGWIVIIDLLGGQCSWHIQDDELEYFNHLDKNAGRKWDGHEEEEKYKRIELSRRIVNAQTVPLVRQHSPP